MEVKAMRGAAEIVRGRILPLTGETQAVSLLLLAALLPALQRYLGAYVAGPGGIGASAGLGGPLRLFAAAFCLFGVIPLAIVVFVFRDDPRAYGLRLGDARRGLASIGLLFPLIALALLFPASRTPEMRAFYPFDASAGDSTGAFIRLEAARGVLFYPAWEFFFRGFLLFGLRRSLGDRIAICIQTIPSCLWHIGLPTGEILGAVAGGVLFGALALRTRSILWPFLLHLLIGVGLDLMIVLARNGGSS
jgi:uncharacterized protein